MVGAGNEEFMFNEVTVSVWEDGKVLAVDGGKWIIITH